MAGKHLTKSKKKRNRVSKHLVSLGFTNRMAIYILLFLAAGLAGGYDLAKESIQTGYTGALMCWTIVFTPIGTVAGVAIGKVVDKNKAENTSGNGDGITFASAQARGFVREEEGDINSPPI